MVTHVYRVLGGSVRKEGSCEHEGCTKSARGGTFYCSAHGGGNRCDHEGCTKRARGSTSFCLAHWTCKRCEQFSDPAVLVGLVKFVIVRGMHVYPELGEKREEAEKSSCEHDDDDEYKPVWSRNLVGGGCQISSSHKIYQQYRIGCARVPPGIG